MATVSDKHLSGVGLCHLCSVDSGVVGGVGSVVERRSLAAYFPCPAPDLQLTGDHSRFKPSAAGQPTRSTQPFILSGSINE